MNAADVIRQIALERGTTTIHNEKPDLVPLKDLNVHKREIWCLSITAEPESYFAEMDRKYRNRTGYYCKFRLQNLEEGLRLCRELSENYGTQPCEMLSKYLHTPDKPIYLVVHVHPEFNFSPKAQSPLAVTSELVMNFV